MAHEESLPSVAQNQVALLKRLLKSGQTDSRLTTYHWQRRDLGMMINSTGRRNIPRASILVEGQNVEAINLPKKRLGRGGGRGKDDAGLLQNGSFAGMAGEFMGAVRPVPVAVYAVPIFRHGNNFYFREIQGGNQVPTSTTVLSVFKSDLYAEPPTENKLAKRVSIAITPPCDGQVSNYTDLVRRLHPSEWVPELVQIRTEPALRDSYPGWQKTWGESLPVEIKVPTTHANEKFHKDCGVKFLLRKYSVNLIVKPLALFLGHLSRPCANEEQRSFILEQNSSLLHGFKIVSGYPGSGKSHTCAVLFALALWDAAPKGQDKNTSTAEVDDSVDDPHDTADTSPDDHAREKASD
ncbi:hypothetical protein F4680DRAFT_464098 [Xylaria scruposa]|nr:hypothetical protein F4680DRAFT_464098 [Xylaria scruposa]